MTQPVITIVPLENFSNDPNNARVHTAIGNEALEAGVQAFGFARSLVADKDNRIRAGNGTLAAAKKRGIKEAIVVETDGTRAVVVKRTDWSPEESIAYGLSDNRLGEMSGWNKDQAQLLTQQLLAHNEAWGDVLQQVGFTSAQLGDLLTTVAQHERAQAGEAEEMKLRFSVIVDFEREQEQATLVKELETRGFACRLMIS